jgi:hypothetical protein
MAKYPVETKDQDGVIDAVNNLLSGPSGLGQNFAGFTNPPIQYYDADILAKYNLPEQIPANTPAYLTGNFRAPFTNDSSATKTYVAPIALALSQYIDSRTAKFTFAETQPAPPFAVGNPIRVEGVNDIYNGNYTPTGVTECTTEYVIARFNGDGTVSPAAGGGQVLYDAFRRGALVSTDANAKVTVNGGTDRVFISAQLNNTLSYTCTSDSEFIYTVLITRRTAFPNDDPINPDFVFGESATVAVKNYSCKVATGSGTFPTLDSTADYTVAPPIETIFTAIIDTPGLGYYWYILEVEIDITAGDVVFTQSKFGNRSMSVQVVKQ